jgi:hypothetical protein
LLQKLNPSIEAPVTKILDQIKLNIENPAKGTKLAVSFKNLPDDSGQKLTLKITSHLVGMPFQWNFHADPADSAKVSVSVMQPMALVTWWMLQDLKNFSHS